MFACVNAAGYQMKPMRIKTVELFTEGMPTTDLSIFNIVPTRHACFDFGLLLH